MTKCWNSGNCKEDERCTKICHSPSCGNIGKCVKGARFTCDYCNPDIPGSRQCSGTRICRENGTYCEGVVAWDYVCKRKSSEKILMPYK